MSKASPSTPQAIGSNSTIQVSLDTIIHDDRDDVDTANNQIILPLDGGYVLTGNVSFDNVTSAGVLGVGIHVNGSTVVTTEQETEGSTATDARNRINTSTVVRASGGDTVTLHAAASDGATADTLTDNAQTHLAVCQVTA